MVDARFLIVGDDSQWLRIRLQEEIIAHGLEGNVLPAGGKTYAVVVSGDKSKVKRLYSDLDQFLPEGVQAAELAISPKKMPRGVRIRGALANIQAAGDKDATLEYLKEIEKTMTRLEQKMNKVIALLEEGDIKPRTREAEDEETFEESNMEVDEEATGGFAAMFG